jgi:uncharacterized protein YxjI
VACDLVQVKGRNDQLIDIINLIVKDVQGNFLTQFQEKINFLLPLIWQKTKGREGQSTQ